MKSNPVILSIQFKSFADAKPAINPRRYSTSYGGTHSSDWCACVALDGTVCTERFEYFGSSSLEDPVLTTRSAHIMRNYKYWAYIKDIEQVIETLMGISK